MLAERGLTQGDLMRLSGQARIEAEVDVHQEVARRMRQTRLLDIRV